MGLSSLCRAFSRKASREDYIEAKDERNRLLALKAKARTLDVLLAGICVLAAAGLVGYILTDQMAWGYLFFGPACWRASTGFPLS